MALNDRQRRFVEFLTNGMDAGPAYVKAGYSPKGADSSASTLQRIPKVAEAIRAERDRLREEARVTKHEAIEWLASVLRTPVGDLDETSPLVQDVTREAIGNSTTRTRIRMAGKMEAIEKLSKMLGWYAPEKVDAKVVVEVVKKW